MTSLLWQHKNNQEESPGWGRDSVSWSQGHHRAKGDCHHTGSNHQTFIEIFQEFYETNPGLFFARREESWSSLWWLHNIKQLFVCLEMWQLMKWIWVVPLLTLPDWPPEKLRSESVLLLVFNTLGTVSSSDFCSVFWGCFLGSAVCICGQSLASNCTILTTYLVFFSFVLFFVFLMHNQAAYCNTLW